MNYLNWRGRAWYKFLYLALLAAYAFCFLWALPGFALDKLAIAFKLQKYAIIQWGLFFWLGPLGILDIVMRDPSSGKPPPAWALKKGEESK